MCARPVDFDWQILDASEQDEWPPRPPAVDRPAGRGRSDPRTRRHVRLVLLGLLGCLVLVGALAGMGVVGRADQAMTQVEADLATAVAVDVASWLAAPQRMNVGAIDAGRVTVRRAEVHGRLALVDVVVTRPRELWLPAVYRQTHVYRETELGWQRAEPMPDLWGAPAVHRTQRFRIEHRARDAEAVQMAAAGLDELDADLRRELGLESAPIGERLTIAVAPGATPADPADLYLVQTGAALVVPSPSLLPLPLDLSDGEALRQLLAGLLARRALDDALRAAPPAAAWQPLADGLAVWLQNEQLALPSQERTCQAQALARARARGWTPRLQDVQSASPSPAAARADPEQGRLSPRSVAVTLVEYSVDTYGRDRLPVLLDGMHRYRRWDDLLSAVFGVPARDFEAGWQAYLAGRTVRSAS